MLNPSGKDQLKNLSEQSQLHSIIEFLGIPGLLNVLSLLKLAITE